MTSDRGSGLLQSERSSGNLHSSARDSGIGGITIGPVVSRGAPRGQSVTNGDMIIGNQPALDVDAIIRQQQSSVRGPGEGAVMCRSPGENRKSSPVESEGSAASTQVTPSRQLTGETSDMMMIVIMMMMMTDTEKLRKVITELIETERTYVKVIIMAIYPTELIKCVILQHLSYLMNTYLEPLKKETFLSNTEINALFGNIQEIYGFQQQFLQTLENALETEAQFYNLDAPGQFKVGQFKDDHYFSKSRLLGKTHY
mgnify:CR=1 FL=1